MAGPAETSWLGADFSDPHTGILAGRHGTAAMVQRGGIRPARSGSFGLRNLHRAKLVAGEDGRIRGWLVGSGGLIMTTDDLGASWQTPSGEPPQGMALHFDFTQSISRNPPVGRHGNPHPIHPKQRIGPA